jgi:transposase
MKNYNNISSFDQLIEVERGMSNRNTYQRYYYLSIDEKGVSRGHDYFSILSDQSIGVIIDVVEGRTKESVDKLCNKLTKDQRDNVKTICTDMWDAFIYGAKTHFEKAFLFHCGALSRKTKSIQVNTQTPNK